MNNKSAVFNNGRKEVFMNTTTIIRRKTTGATCKCCNRPLNGDAAIFNGVRGSKLYTHENCVKFYGSAINKFNANGGSTQSFEVSAYRPFENADNALAWSMFARSAGFYANGNENGIAIRATVPAQSITKLLKTLNPMLITIDGKHFDNVEKATRYIKSITKGNSHN